MANRDRFATDENLFHEETQDLLALSHIECFSSRAPPTSEGRQGLSHLQIPGFVHCGHRQRVEFRFDRWYLPTQVWHALAQLRQHHQAFLRGVDQALHTLLQSCLFAP